MPPIRTRTIKRSSMRTKTVGGSKVNAKRATYSTAFPTKGRTGSSKTKKTTTSNRVRPGTKTGKRKVVSSKYGMSKKEGFSTYKTYKKTHRKKMIIESQKVKQSFSLYNPNPKAVIKRPVDYEKVIEDLIKSKQLRDNTKLLDCQLMDQSIDSISIEVSDCSSLLEDGYSDEDES